MSVWTGTAAVALDQAAYDRMVYFALRAELYFDAVAEVTPSNQSMPGSSVIFEKFADLAAATTPLTELTDVTLKVLADSQVTVTLNEYGNAVGTSAKLRGTNYVDIDEVAANAIGYNAGISMDTVARDVLALGSNVFYGGGRATRVTLTAPDVLAGNDVRRAVAILRGRNVPTINGWYIAFIHPDQSYDLRGQALGTSGWRDPHVYSEPDGVWNGEIGAFEGARFIETPRAPTFPDTGAGATVDVYRMMVVGRQALAKAWSMIDNNGPYPVVIRGPVTDYLRRLEPIGWYWLGGYAIFRQEAIQAVETSSALGVNV